MNKLKYIIGIIPIIFIIVLLGKVEKQKKQLNTFINNTIALQAEKDSLKNNNILYLHKIEDLQYYGDSIDRRLLQVTKKLKIRRKHILQLGKILSEYRKKDTIYLKDTVFIKNTNVDTTLYNKWYSINLKLKYPNRVDIYPTIVSDKYVIFKSKHVYLKKKSKCFLFRWFQKKQWVIEVVVVDKNPYIKNINNRFIKIMK